MKRIILFLSLITSFQAYAITVTITQSGTVANSCSRALTASVSSGSGAYTYTWSVVSPAITWPTTNNVATVNLALSQTADVNVSVHDVTLNQYASATVTVNRILSGSFDTFIPNLITPNGDGYNDDWIITAADKTFSPINAYAYSVTIKNASNTTVFSASATLSSGHLGIMGGDILWNGRLNGTGSIVATGTYSYQLTLTNCSSTSTYSSSLQVLY